jgi:predicted ATPase/class 3 adenylate cyclase
LSELLRTLAAYIPPGLIRATLRDPSPAVPAGPLAERFPAAVLFADVSGFTPLTEALAQKGSEGPEELTRLLNNYFSRMISLIESEGGEVVKFSGDALTVIFPATDEPLSVAVRRARQAAEAMQAAMTEFSTLRTSAGAVALGMKIGLGAGEILSARVGGLHDRWEYVIAGDPLRQVAQAEHHAQRGQIVLSPEAAALVAPGPVAPRPLAHPNWAALPDAAQVESVLRIYVPRVVITWLKESLQAWLAVLRPMSVLFVGVDGIDYTRPEAVERLNGFLRGAQEVLQHYEGSINKLAVDDKGTILLALLGAPPYGHENDPERALRAAMELRARAEAQGLQLAVGVTTGRVFAGPVGSETRREYTVMGDPVNLAARLMVIAGKGQIRCDFETYRSARGKLAFDLLPPVRVKGKAGLIRIYSPTGAAGRGRADEIGQILVGRKAELARLEAALDKIQSGRSHLLLVEGEAGIGKSRLVEELVRMMRERGVVGLLGMGRSIERQTPYRAWREVFTSFFDLDDVDDPAERRQRVEWRIRDVAPDLAERVPLLNDVLNLDFPENALTASLDTHLRHESLVSLLLALLRAWMAERPLVVVLEDAHWLDTLSWDLALQAARAFGLARVPLLLAVVMRPLDEEAVRPPQPQLLADLPETDHLRLGALAPEETVALAAARLGVSAPDLPEPIAELIRTRADGNPFFAEELVFFLRDRGLVTVAAEDEQTRCAISGDLAQAAQSLPDTIQGLVLSRIDRLPPDEQLTLKVAAVIGRTFVFSILRHTLGAQMEVSDRLLKAHLDDLSKLDLTPLEAPEPELTYIFKHIITQEAAYETLLFAQRRQLHRTVAEWYERSLREDIEHSIGELALPLLVYHWHQAEDRERERHYAALAGRWAAEQFANIEAAGYFTRALELTPADAVDARYDLLLAREAVNDLRGERPAQAEDLSALTAIVQALDDPRRGAETALRQANYAEVISDYPTALDAARRGVALAKEAQAVSLEAQAHTLWGQVLWRQGNYDAARAPLEHALVLARATQDRRAEARGLYYLGDVYLYQGNHAAAQAEYQRALEVYRAENHRQGEADSLNNLGMIQNELGDLTGARDYYEQVLGIYRAIGDRRGETITLNNLGVTYCDLGDYAAARDYHEQALALRLTIGDRWGQANSLVNLGLIYHGLGDNETARKNCERALAIQREIGDRRGEGYSLTYLGHALAGLGEYEAAAKAYAEALHLRRELGQHGLTMDDLAGLARVALAQGQLGRAQELVREILAWVDANGTGGIEYPLQVYLTCYQVLRASADGDLSAMDRAREILSTAHTLLQEQAARVRDPGLRRSFLEGVPANRDILAAWQAQ